MAATLRFEGWTPIKRTGDLMRLAFLGLTGLFGNQVLFILGMQRTSQYTRSHN